MASLYSKESVIVHIVLVFAYVLTCASDIKCDSQEDGHVWYDD